MQIAELQNRILKILGDVKISRKGISYEYQATKNEIRISESKQGRKIFNVQILSPDLYGRQDLADLKNDLEIAADFF